MKRLNYTHFICLLIFSVTYLIAGAQNRSGESAKSSSLVNALTKDVSSHDEITFNIVGAANHTYGYEILVKNKILIRQLTIPGRNGIQGFKNKIDAEKVARLVIKKLAQGIMPPTVDTQELDSLHTDY